MSCVCFIALPFLFRFSEPGAPGDAVKCQALDVDFDTRSSASIHRTNLRRTSSLVRTRRGFVRKSTTAGLWMLTLEHLQSKGVADSDEVIYRGCGEAPSHVEIELLLRC